MIHLKYKFKVNFVKLPLIWIDLCLKLVFENATAGRNTGCRSVVNCASCQTPIQNETCINGKTVYEKYMYIQYLEPH